ncbi:flavodoxin [Anaerotignum sp.]|uniref:flavodoxin n=1 Tax=Anaerotignum sp. TaxID=2039241 RepID=UPI0027150D10|nr:flavodoxin [Anaerotignum sp.]
MKTLILYYSYTGNTRKIAKMIAEKIDSDLVEIKTVMPYEGSYDDVVNQAQREVNSGFHPEIFPLDVNMKDYDTVILGSPVWWYTYAPAVATTLSQLSLERKTVYPFATNAGWLGHTFQDVSKACVNANVQKGLNVRFDENRLITSNAEIDKWIESMHEEV